MTLKTMTLKEACDAYVTYMTESGQKPSTLGTIQRTLTLLVEEMGESKEVGKILPVHVDKFYKSEKATMQPGKDGLKPRAEASVLQIRRIVRMALVWWKEQGYMERLAVPGSERVFIDKAEKRAAERANAEAQTKRGRKAKQQTDGEAEAAEPDETEPSDEQADEQAATTGEEE